jgi:hypothetical protein
VSFIPSPFGENTFGIAIFGITFISTVSLATQPLVLIAVSV